MPASSPTSRRAKRGATRRRLQRRSLRATAGIAAVLALAFALDLVSRGRVPTKSTRGPVITDVALTTTPLTSTTLATTTTAATTTTTTVPPGEARPGPGSASDLVAPKPPGPVDMPPGVQVVSRVPTTDKVVFLTIDDGQVRDPEFTKRYRDTGIPITMFPISRLAANDPQFFKDWLAAGAHLGDHTVSHPNLNLLSLAQQQSEICDARDQLTQALGAAPKMFRPPYGNHNANTALAAAKCNFRYIILWREAVNEGRVQFQIGSTLQPGDIILMHWRTTFDEDFDSAVAKARADGMQFGYLDDYLPQ